MEHQPHNPEDRDRDTPERERLWPGEIDLTGVVEQDDALADVIGDALSEVEGTDEEVPEWGARTLARALANQLDDPQSGALHHFAVTGRADKEAIGIELAGIYEGTTDEEIKEWVNRLGTYIIRLPDDDGADLGQQTDAAEHTDSPQIAEGIREHGDAFRAFLELPDTDPGQADLLENFHAFYVGAYASMESLLAGLTEISEWQQAVSELEDRLGIDGYVTLDHSQIERTARETWDIVKIGETFYVFDK